MASAQTGTNVVDVRLYAVGCDDVARLLIGLARTQPLARDHYGPVADHALRPCRHGRITFPLRIDLGRVGVAKTAGDHGVRRDGESAEFADGIQRGMRDCAVTDRGGRRLGPGRHQVICNVIVVTAQ